MSHHVAIFCHSYECVHNPKHRIGCSDYSKVMSSVIVQMAYVINVYAWLPDNMFCFSSPSSSQECRPPFDLHQPHLSTTLQTSSLLFEACYWLCFVLLLQFCFYAFCQHVEPIGFTFQNFGQYGFCLCSSNMSSFSLRPIKLYFSGHISTIAVSVILTYLVFPASAVTPIYKCQ